MRAEDERHEQLRRRAAEADRDDDDDREQRGHGAVHADERRQAGDQQDHQDEQARPALADPGDELLTGPRRDAARVEALADDEQGRDEDDRRVAEPGKRLVERRGCP